MIELKLDTMQSKVVHSSASKILCLASAGAGKTRALTERIKYLITEKKVAPSKIVAITFSNMARDEMARRLNNIRGEMFIGTVHAYANWICRKNGIDTSQYIIRGNFNKLIDVALKIKSSQYERIEYLFIDECQDLCQNEYDFIMKIPTQNIFFVGDERQAIYGFKGSSDEFLYEMYRNPEYEKYYLTSNYRCAPEIIAKANSYLGSFKALSPAPVAVKCTQGYVYEENLMDAISDLEDLKNYGDWFILARTNAEIEEIQKILNRKGIPNITFRKSDFTVAELDEVLAENRVKVLTGHSAKGLESPNVIMTGFKTYNLEERKITYVAATRAESVLYICPSIPHKRGKKNNVMEMGNVWNKSKQGLVDF